MAHRGEAARRTERFRCAAGARDYQVHLPARPQGRPRDLVVMLHGCEQDPEVFARGTGMNGHAERHGMLVLYPGQPMSGNVRRCWNWYRPEGHGQEHGHAPISMPARLPRCFRCCKA